MLASNISVIVRIRKDDAKTPCYGKNPFMVSAVTYNNLMGHTLINTSSQTSRTSQASKPRRVLTCLVYIGAFLRA
jgi:hypothetical protein